MGALSSRQDTTLTVHTTDAQRVTFVEHLGRRILRLDLLGLGNGELPAAIEQLLTFISQEPPHSVRLMVVGQGNIPINGDLVATVRHYASRKAPEARATALVGATSFQKVLFFSLPNSDKKKRNAFDLEDEAMDWLVEQ